MLVSRTYNFDFDHPVSKLWELVSDTPRWGEASGFPKYLVSENLQEDGTVKVSGKIKIAGMTLNWEEPPVTWVAERWFEQRRLFTKGPMLSMSNIARLEDKGSTSGLSLELIFDSRNLLGTFIAKRLLAAFDAKVQLLLENADRLIRAEQPELFVSSYQPSPSLQQRAEKLRKKIEATPYEHGLSPKLVKYINASQEVDLWAMRPIAIARGWGADTRDVIELFLQAVRSGLLESRWDILCPRCRVSKSVSSNIGELPRGVHCDACNIDFESDFASNVELSFSPSPSVRAVEYGHYCRSGPGVTPHIKSQCSLAPGASKSLPLTLKAGDYRFRTLEAGGELVVTWKNGDFPKILVHDQHVELDGASPPNEITIVNNGNVQRTIVIEELDWLRDVLTAERATTLQAFRDLFSEQVLRPGDDVSIRNISFLFSDLVGSAHLFSQLGDAEAYHIVREHFAELGEIVRRHAGSIVKTTGDGIHAAFLTPDDALRASVEMQRSMPGFNERLGSDHISIRIGLHSGSSIAVTLNGGLDYYGAAVNLAARLEGVGEAGDITMSNVFAGDPSIEAMLIDYEKHEGEQLMKGFTKATGYLKIKP